MFDALKGLDRKIYEKVVFKIMQVPQPWHPASCTKHLAARAIAMICEEKKQETGPEGLPIVLHFWGYGNKVITAEDGIMEKGTKLVIDDWNHENREAKMWIWDEGVIRSFKDPNFVIDLPDANTDNANKLQIWENNGNDAQKWILDDHAIRSAVDENKSMDLAGGNTNSGNHTPIQLWDHNDDNANQMWGYRNAMEKFTFWDFADILFNLDMKHEDVINKSFADLHQEIADALPAFMREEFLNKMAPENISQTAGKQLKWFVRYHRTRGVHVTPTVFVNGIEEGEISSGWNADQWADYISNFLQEEE